MVDRKRLAREIPRVTFCVVRHRLSLDYLHTAVEIGHFAGLHCSNLYTMKLFVSGLVLALLPFALAVKSWKSVVVSYPHGTPDSVVDSAKQAIVAAVWCFFLSYKGTSLHSSADFLLHIREA